MNKAKFLKKLEEKLLILDDNERKDILDEYSATIDEKISHGKSEEDAIADFGSIDTLTKEILEAYKINPNFNNPKDDNKDEDFKKLLAATDSLIKKGAKKATDFYEEVVDKVNSSGKKITTENIFEIVFKSMIILFLLLIPFQFFNYVVRVIANSVMFYPINILVRFLLGVTGTILYFLLAYIIVTHIINSVVGTTREVPKKEVKKTKTVKEEKNEEKVVVKESKIIEIAYTILKVMIFLWSLPLIGVILSLYFGIIALIYLMYKGLFLIGFTVLLLGLIILFSHLLSSIYKLIFTKNKIYFYPLVISISLIIVGIFMSIDYAYNLKYVNDLPADQFEIRKDITSITINKPTYFPYNVEEEDIIIDNTIADNVLVIETSYYKDFISGVSIIFDDSGSACEPSDEVCNMMYVNRHRIYINGQEKSNIRYSSLAKVIDGLKDNKFYPLEKALDFDVKVKVNEKTRAQIIFTDLY